MWNEAGPLRGMRAALRAQLPPRAFLKRDRGAFLFVTNAPAFDSAPNAPSGFIIERRGALMALLPDAGWVARFERSAPPDDLSASALRFRGQTPDRANLMLFSDGVKLTDAGASASPQDIAAYDRALRQRIARALRGGCGGGLYACALLNAALNRFIPTEDAK